MYACNQGVDKVLLSDQDYVSCLLLQNYVMSTQWKNGLHKHACSHRDKEGELKCLARLPHNSSWFFMHTHLYIKFFETLT